METPIRNQTTLDASRYPDIEDIAMSTKARATTYNNALRLRRRACRLMVAIARNGNTGPGWLEALLWTRSLQDIMSTDYLWEDTVDDMTGYRRYFWENTTDDELEAAQKTVDMWCDAFGSIEGKPTMEEAIERFK